MDAIERRMEGLQQALSNQDAVKLTRILKFDRRPENVYEEVMKLLDGPTPADGIFVSIGALEQTARAVRDSCTGRVPCVIGYDLNEEISGYMEQGLIAASIGHEPFQQGYYAVKVLYQYLNSGISPAKPALYLSLIHISYDPFCEVCGSLFQKYPECGRWCWLRKAESC